MSRRFVSKHNIAQFDDGIELRIEINCLCFASATYSCKERVIFFESSPVFLGLAFVDFKNTCANDFVEAAVEFNDFGVGPVFFLLSADAVDLEGFVEEVSAELSDLLSRGLVHAIKHYLEEVLAAVLEEDFLY